VVEYLEIYVCIRHRKFFIYVDEEGLNLITGSLGNKKITNYLKATLAKRATVGPKRYRLGNSTDSVHQLWDHQAKRRSFHISSCLRRRLSCARNHRTIRSSITGSSRRQGLDFTGAQPSLRARIPYCSLAEKNHGVAPFSKPMAYGHNRKGQRMSTVYLCQISLKA
jgi:hypothetical protein